MSPLEFYFGLSVRSQCIFAQPRTRYFRCALHGPVTREEKSWQISSVISRRKIAEKKVSK